MWRPRIKSLSGPFYKLLLLLLYIIHTKYYILYYLYTMNYLDHFHVATDHSHTGETSPIPHPYTFPYTLSAVDKWHPQCQTPFPSVFEVILQQTEHAHQLSLTCPVSSTAEMQDARCQIVTNVTLSQVSCINQSAWKLHDAKTFCTDMKVLKAILLYFLFIKSTLIDKDNISQFLKTPPFLKS